MKLLILSLALVGSVFALPIDEKVPQPEPSPDQPIALPATEAKTAAKASDVLEIKITTGDWTPIVTPESKTVPKQEDTVIPLDDKKKVEVRSTAEPSVVSQVPEIPPAVPEEAATDVKKEEEPQRKSSVAEPAPNVPAGIAHHEQDNIANFGGMNVAEATGQLAAIAEETLPSILKTDFVPTREHKIDIANPPKLRSEPEEPIEGAGGKMGPVTPQEKRETDPAPKDEKKNNTPAGSDESDSEESKESNESKEGGEIKAATPSQSPVAEAKEQAAGLTDDTVRVIRDTIDGEKKTETKHDETSGESNESKDEDSAASHKGHTSSEDSSDDKDKEEETKTAKALEPVKP